MVAGMKGLYAPMLVYNWANPSLLVNVPTTPLAHCPFRRQTAERPEVSPGVIYDGLVKDSSVLNQVL